MWTGSRPGTEAALLGGLLCESEVDCPCGSLRRSQSQRLLRARPLTIRIARLVKLSLLGHDIIVADHFCSFCMERAWDFPFGILAKKLAMRESQAFFQRRTLDS